MKRTRNADIENVSKVISSYLKNTNNLQSLQQTSKQMKQTIDEDLVLKLYKNLKQNIKKKINNANFYENAQGQEASMMVEMGPIAQLQLNKLENYMQNYKKKNSKEKFKNAKQYFKNIKKKLIEEERKIVLSNLYSNEFQMGPINGMY